MNSNPIELLVEAPHHDDNVSRKKIAIVGNMNNAGFCLMRYFRDLGVDAHLLPYATDGKGGLSHFRPEDDTWSPDLWTPYIHPLSLPNRSASLLSIPWAGKSVLDSELRGYQTFIGSGIAPALFAQWGRPLDIFFPYSMGIEFYANINFTLRNRFNPAYWAWRSYVRRLQARGIRDARHCFNAEMSGTRQSFDSLGVPFERIAIPAVYNRESVATRGTFEKQCVALREIGATGFSIFCCARQIWVRKSNMSAVEWNIRSKNSDWLLRGFAEFIERSPEKDARLFIVAYGEDEQASRALCQELGITAHVTWLDIMPRREIMLLIEACDVVCGEFYASDGVIWGGTGWEALASGKPLLQSFNFTDAAFEAEFGYPPPPILDVKSPAELARHLSEMRRDHTRRLAIGQASADWFNKHNGIGLARQWLEFIDEGN